MVHHGWILESSVHAALHPPLPLCHPFLNFLFFFLLFHSLTSLLLALTFSAFSAIFSGSWMSATIRNGSPTQNGINFSLVRPPPRPPLSRTCACVYAHSGGTGGAQCKPIPLWLSANKWLPAGWKKGMVRNALNHFQLIAPTQSKANPSSFLRSDLKRTVSPWSVWRGHLGLLLALILIYYPRQQHVRLAADLLASGSH